MKSIEERLKNQDLIGKKVGKLTVIGFHSVDEAHHIIYKCKCDCGNECLVQDTGLKYGLRSSCGCSRGKHGLAPKRNGDRHLYDTWISIKQRCYHPANLYRKERYMDRGITVCDEWLHDYKAFHDWSIANGYNRDNLYANGRNKLSLDRIDNDKGYSPDNCRWTDTSTQNRNKSSLYREKTKIKFSYKRGVGIKVEDNSYCVAIPFDITKYDLFIFNVGGEEIKIRKNELIDFIKNTIR